MQYSNYPAFNAPEIDALSEAGFKEEEIKELNAIKETMQSEDSKIRRAIMVAIMGLNYFIGANFTPEIIPTQISETQYGFQIKTKEHFALNAIVTLTGNEEDDMPSTIRYCFGLGDNLNKIIREIPYHGDIETLLPQFMLYLELTAYSFNIKNDGEKERNQVFEGDLLESIVIHPTPGKLGLFGMFYASPIKQ